MTSTNAGRWIAFFLTCVVFGMGVLASGCGGDGGDTDGSVGDASTDGNPFITPGDSGVGSLTIQPANPTVNVTITDGVVTTTPLTFIALSNSGSMPVPATFTLDRGELGSLGASSGVFTASGNVSGTGNVTATFKSATATTTVTVVISMSQNGKPTYGDAGTGSKLGGNNGVGGNDYGAPVGSATQAVLDGPATAPASAQELGFIYPYDQTVWPQGILAPLLQWRSSHAAVTTAVKIHLAEKGFTFDGYYAAPKWVNEPIDEAAWSRALMGNMGDPLQVDLYITDGTTSWGPITEQWKVGHGVLKGTVYYNSYNSQLPTGGSPAVLAIRPGAMAPTIAVPGTGTSCHGCHEVSANGSTIFITNGDYTTTASYDLTNNGKPIKGYGGASAAPDGTSNTAKFVWSGVYPDGTFAMTDGNGTREGPWFQGNSLASDLYRRSDGSRVTFGGSITETGWRNVVSSAVTPIFSPDGKRLAFNFWAGAGAGGVVARGGHSLDMVDFDCGQGQVTGAPTQCGGTTYAFSNLRELYYSASRFVGWPGFTPNSNGIIFHNTVTVSSNTPDPWLVTWGGAQAELWYTDLGTPPSPIRMNWLNGLDASGTSYLPTNGLHPTDWKLNYEPTVNPIASGGYFWVVFTSRRMYGNVAAGDPYDNGNGTYPIPKKLWVAAVDMNPTPGTDPSHPAFYLPGQELNAGNLRGFWVVDPCKGDGSSCATGDECCNGFCRNDADAGGLVCTSKQGCANEFEACVTDADCCGNVSLICINNHCALQTPN